MNVEQLVKCKFVGRTEVLGQKQPQRHFALHKSHVTRPGIETRPPWWESGA
jgi:hypothetical protein